jgi:hypothetical protein
VTLAGALVVSGLLVTITALPAAADWPPCTATVTSSCVPQFPSGGVAFAATFSGPTSISVSPANCPKGSVPQQNGYSCSTPVTFGLAIQKDSPTVYNIKVGSTSETNSNIVYSWAPATKVPNDYTGWCEVNPTTAGCKGSNTTSLPLYLVVVHAIPSDTLLTCGSGQYQYGDAFEGCIQIAITNTTSSPTTTTTVKHTHRKHSSAISITMVTTPKSLNLAVDKTGAVTPKNVSVAVTLKNTTKKTITGVQLTGLDPEPQDETQSLNQLALAKKSIPLTFGTIAAGASLKKTFTLSVTGDGKYQWRALAQYNKPSASGGNGFATATGGPFESTVPPLFFAGKLESDNVYKQGGAPWVKAGDSWYITADVKNVSAYKTLCVAPLLPTYTGNAAGIGPHDITVATPTQNAPPFAGTLTPGQSATVEMYVATSTDGATRGEVAFAPSGAVLDAGQTCNADTYANLKPLASDDITIPKDTADFTVHVDTSVPTGTTNSPGVNALIFTLSMPIGALHTLFDSAVALKASAEDAISVQNLYSSLLSWFPPTAAAKAAISSYQQLVVADQVMADYWNSASLADKQNFITQVDSALRREAGDFWSAASGTVRDAAQGYMDQVTQAYASGDDTAIFSLFGQSTGSAVAAVGTQIALAEAGSQILAKAPALQAAFEEVAGSSVTIAALKDMPPGKVLNFTEMQRLWGLSKQDLAAFSRIAEENDVLIGVRGRAPISVENLEEGAVWKHENLKPKNVSPVDTEYLGFPSSSTGTVQFRTYTAAEESQILAAIKNADLSPADYKVVMARYQTRVGESKYIKTIEGYSKAGEINVGFNYADNGISQATTRQIRKFKLVEEPLPGGGTLYTPYQENLDLYKLRKSGTLPSMCERALGSVLCRVTGDMDGVYVTSTSGGNVPQAKLIKVYNELANAGWQHPETLTWINDAGDFMFGAKQKILEGLQVGGEALIQFAPNGKQYATYLDLAKSKLISSENYLLDIVGGYTNLATTGS